MKHNDNQKTKESILKMMKTIHQAINSQKFHLKQKNLSKGGKKRDIFISVKADSIHSQQTCTTNKLINKMLKEAH